MGATTLTISNTGGTDHQSFDGIGLPGFQFIQDEIEYDTRTHHSNQDVFDRIQADDMKQAAVIMAAFVYNTAMRDEKLPRKPAPSEPPPTRRRRPPGDHRRPRLRATDSREDRLWSRRRSSAIPHSHKKTIPADLELRTPWASGRSLPQLIVQVCRRM